MLLLLLLLLLTCGVYEALSWFDLEAGAHLNFGSKVPGSLLSTWSLLSLQRTLSALLSVEPAAA